MAHAEAPDLCLRDVVLQFSVESLRVDPGLLSTAVVLGCVIGTAAAVLICVLLLLTHLSRKEKDSGIILESSSSGISGHVCETHSNWKGKTCSQATNQKPIVEEDKHLSNSDVAAFALKAKVIYPINQKFRPLADGASNPSLHESYKQAHLPNQMFEGSSSNSIESLSHGEKEDCSSSTTIHSTTSEDRFYERTFIKVASFPEVLTCNSCDVKLCLYSLCLQSLPLLDTELRQEQHKMFVQILRINLSDLLLKKKIDGELYSGILSAQEAELEALEERYHRRITCTKLSRAQSSEFQTMQDIERREREYSEHLINNLEGFWKQIEKVNQFLLDQSKCTYDEAGRIVMDLISQMMTVEGILCDSQELHAMEIQEKMIRWEHMAKVVDSLKYEIQEESECRLSAVSKTLEQLTIKKKLSARQKELHLTELFKAFWEELSQFNSECFQQTKALVTKLLGHRSKLIDGLRKTQKEEQLSFLNKAQDIADPDSFIQAYHKLLEKQRELCCDLEEEEDCKAIDAVADLCKDLYCGASQTFEKLVKALFLQTLPEITNLTLGECQSLKQELRNYLSVELEKAENERKTRIQLFRDLLLQEKQLWAKEHVLASALQNYASGKHEQIIQGVLIRLSGLSEESNKITLQRHQFFLRSALRTLALRNISMATLTQMKMSRKKILLQELQEQHTLEKSKWHCQDEVQWQFQNEMEAHILEEERKLEAETLQTRTDFQQQLLADQNEAIHIIRQHMERVIGQALVQQAQQEAAKSMMEDNTEFKERLVEAAVESVYVTSNSVNRLVESYNRNIEQIFKDCEEEKSKQLREVKGMAKINKQKNQHELSTLSSKEKLSCQPANSDLHKRLCFQQKQLMEKFSVYQHIRLDSLKQKKLVLHLLETHLENKLKDAEQDFIAELAAMARIRLTDGSNVMNKTLHSESTSKNHSTKKLK
ncbi:evC complex member EVC isoform X2 [Ascaphus truei]|uniref:evC complex member EVC isoform X2 n=1 Tax=Ascaphus truei TaxID=8439 RepID=UPI003F59FED1